MLDELTPEQKEMAKEARRKYLRGRREAQRRIYDRYWYNRALREQEEVESSGETDTQANG